MGSESASIEERLKSLFAQLKTEAGILDRIVYKGKNQHRRCAYFQYLLKVRRDVKLLLSAGLQDILIFHFQVIDGKKPKQKLYLLERLKGKKHYGVKYNFQERLLGVAHLLSEMVESILKAAVQISTLLACSFFMGFSITVLALLARLRILVQQVLLDLVSVYNMVSSIAQKEQHVKLKEDDIEVYQEYHPPNGEILTLECVWEGDKYVLVEKTCKIMKIQGKDHAPEGDPSLVTPLLQYQRLEVSSEDDEFARVKVPAKNINVEATCSIEDIKRQTVGACSDQSTESNDDLEVKGKAIQNEINYECSNEADFTADASTVAGMNSSSGFKTGSDARLKKVAFVPVRKSAPSETNDDGPSKKMRADWFFKNGDESGDPFFSLLTAGNMKESLF